MKIETIIWLLPAVFMIHDFEEIVMMRAWVQRNRAQLSRRLPRFLPHFESLSTASFALAVAEEFLLLVLITVLAVELGWVLLWMCTLLAFGVHLVVHVGQWLAFRRYVPTVITSALALLYCIPAFFAVQARYRFGAGELLLTTLLVLVALVINLLLVHRAAARFEYWLGGFSAGQEEKGS